MTKPNFFVTTTSTHGGFMRTDMDSYLGLIRRMIQQKCATTQDLIQSIRRNKIGESGHVTPNEFRFTLIKFGVILPQALVDKIFTVFDSDRSGTMDFDEFAMWIMNSEFHHHDESADRRVKAQLNQSEQERLRQKLLVCIEQNKQVFQYMKKSISFMEFISEVNRQSMPLLEREARSIFVIFDPADTGFMDTTKLRHWAATGVVQTPPATASSAAAKARRVLPTLQQSISRICGKNSLLLAQCFAHLPRGKGVRLPFEEFRRCLLSNGLGQNAFDTRDFFDILSGSGAGAGAGAGAGDIDGLEVVGGGEGGGKGKGASVDMLLDALFVPPPLPEQEVSQKKAKPAFSFTSHAHRRLREALRKSFKVLKAELEIVDKGNTGWIDAQQFHQLLLKYAMPMTFQDFRYITMQFKTEEGGSKVNWQQFLAAYLPTKAPHMLDGVKESIPEVPELTQKHHHAASSGALPTVASPIRTRPPSGAEGATAGLGPSVSSGAKVAAAFKQQLSLQTQSLSQPQQPAAAVAKPKPISMRDEISTKDQDPHGEMRRIWQAVLRECHRSDPDRSGCVSRIAFINALESANLNKVRLIPRISLLALWGCCLLHERSLLDCLF